MSASNEKAAREAKLARRQQAEDEQAKKNRAFKRNAIIVVVVVVLLVAAALVITSDLFYTAFPAVTIGNTSYSAAETDVFYRSAYNSFYSNYSQTIQSLFGTDVDVDSYIQSMVGLDRSTALDEQQYSEDQTWAEYFMEQAQENMKQVTALCDDAAKAGFTLPQEALDEIDSQISSLSLSASLYGYSSLNQFLSLNYGKGVNEKVFRSVLTKMETASHYAEQVEEARTYSAEDLNAYYEEHADELDVIGYYSFLVSSTNSAFDGEADDDAKLAAARAAAEEIASAATLEDYLAAAAEYGTAPTIRYTAGASLTSDTQEWLLSADRKSGDAAAVESSSGAYALWFDSRDNNDYALRSMRHILINAVADEDGNYSDEAIFAAQTRIHEIENEWKENPTEEHFAELANSYSDDGGSNTNGGLYEDIQKHSMVENIDSFLFNEAKNVGDTTIVEGNNGSYEGWHLVYYVGEGENARDALAKPAMQEADQNAWVESLQEGYTVSTGSGLKYVKVS